MTHEIIETAHGLQLEVEGSPVALIRRRDGSTDLIWQIRGPQNIEVARRAMTGLIDLVIAYDQLQLKAKKQKG